MSSGFFEEIAQPDLEVTDRPSTAEVGGTPLTAEHGSEIAIAPEIDVAPSATTMPSQAGNFAEHLRSQPVEPGYTAPSQSSEAVATKLPRASTNAMEHPADRSGVPSFRSDHSTDNEPLALQSGAGVPPPRRLKKSSSCVRLSMTFDGNAEVVTKDGSSPSPPRVPQVPQALIGSSHEVRPDVPNRAEKIPFARPLQRATSGRSRDSRAWEFWCDKDSRGELGDKAVKDASGSAADAIGLLRSTSGRSILGTIPMKRNSVLPRQQSAMKRSKLDLPKPVLQRSSTTSGRLQGKPLGSISQSVKPAPKLKQMKSAVSTYTPGNDSDKENWSPEADVYSDEGSDVVMQSVGQDESTSASLTTVKRTPRGAAPTVRTLSNRKPQQSLSKENHDPEADPELAAFMRGSHKSNSISEEEDLDCIQGLLSLSQGNWR